MNLKQLVVSSEHDEPVTMYLRKQGPGEVTAADIAPPAGVEVHNPELVLATLNDKGKLDMELVVERGRGYVSAVQNKAGDTEIGRMPVDSIYSPVLKVTYKVEATRVEQRTDFDRLIIDVETKPSMQPRDALASAGKTLVELFGLARELNVEAEGIDIGPSPVDEQLAADLALPVEDLQLTVRSYNCLKREGIHTVGELLSRSEQDLLDIRNFGSKSIDEVKAKLAEMGLSLKDSAPGFDPSLVVDAVRRRRRRQLRRGRAVLIRPPTARSTRVPDTARESEDDMPTPPRVHASAAARRTRSSSWPTWPRACSSTARSPPRRPRRARLRPFAERLITKAKRGDLHNRRQVLAIIRDKTVVHILFTEIGPRYAERPGGYTRITKIGPRKGDNAPMAVIALVEAEFTPKAVRPSAPARRPACRPGASRDDAAEATVEAEAVER